MAAAKSGTKKAEGKIAKRMERDEQDKVRAEQEDLKVLEAKARREEIVRRELPKRRG